MDCLESSGRILVSSSSEERIKTAENLIRKTLEENETIKQRTYIEKTGKDTDIVFIRIGEPIEGFKGLYNDKKLQPAILIKKVI